MPPRYNLRESKEKAVLLLRGDVSDKFKLLLNTDLFDRFIRATLVYCSATILFPQTEVTTDLFHLLAETYTVVLTTNPTPVHHHKRASFVKYKFDAEELPAYYNKAHLERQYFETIYHVITRIVLGAFHPWYWPTLSAELSRIFRTSLFNSDAQRSVPQAEGFLTLQQKWERSFVVPTRPTALTMNTPSEIARQKDIARQARRRRTTHAPRTASVRKSFDARSPLLSSLMPGREERVKPYNTIYEELKKSPRAATLPARLPVVKDAPVPPRVIESAAARAIHGKPHASTMPLSAMGSLAPLPEAPGATSAATAAPPKRSIGMVQGRVGRGGAALTSGRSPVLGQHRYQSGSFAFKPVSVEQVSTTLAQGIDLGKQPGEKDTVMSGFFEAVASRRTALSGLDSEATAQLEHSIAEQIWRINHLADAVQPPSALDREEQATTRTQYNPSASALNASTMQQVSQSLTGPFQTGMPSLN